MDGFELRGFSSTLALEALSELGDGLEALAESGARGRVRAGVLGAEPLLFIPDAAALEPSGEPRPTYRKLLEVLDRRAPHFERQEHRLEGDGWWRLDQALSLFLIESARDDEPAEPEEGESLVIDRRDDAERAAKLCDDLRFHATHCRLAATTAPDGGRTLLVHVLADPERKPSLAGLAASGALDELDRLDAFQAGGKVVFVGGGRKPSLRALRAFCDLLASLAPGMASAERLVAIVPHVDEAGIRVELYPLAGLDFVDQADITPAPSARAEVEVLSLVRSEAELRQLRQRLAVAQPRVGRHLELRPAPPSEGPDRELEHVVGKLAELEQRRAYLESLRQPRPVLLRYTQRQLAALADAIRRFPSLEVRDGKVLYAFQATEDNPAGWHYLFFNPGEAVESDPAPPWRWAELEERLDLDGPPNESTRFWVDPLWADDYHGAGSSLLFVPRGSVLFPSLHSWRRAEMDTYLGNLLRQWFPDERRLAGLPKRALYLFDEVRLETGSRGEIRIQVLDQDGFTPLTEEIGWLNDNLRLQHALGGVEELVARLSDREAHRRLAAVFEREARRAEAAFELAAHHANEKLAEGATELLDAMTEEIAKIAERCRLASEEIPRIHELLRETAAALERLKLARARAGDAVSATTRAVGENLQWVRLLDEELDKLEADRDRLEMRARMAIEEVERRYRGLVRRLKG